MNMKKALNRFLKMTKGKLTFRLSYCDRFPKRKRTMKSSLESNNDTTQCKKKG